MSNKRVLIFSTAYFPFVGGAEVAIKEITDRLGNGMDFDLITARLQRNLPKFERIGNINVYRIGFGLPFVDKMTMALFGVFKVLNLHTEHPYDVFWSVMATFASGAGYATNILRWFMGKKKIPMVLTLQEGDSEMYLRRSWIGILHISWLLALPRTDVLTAISAYLLGRARSLGYKGRAEIIPNGVDVKRFEPTISRLPHTETILITTSRLVEKNGVGDIIESLKFLPDSVILQVIGIGPLEQQLKLQVRNLKLENRVKFLGLINQEEIPKYLHEADIFIRPSLSEGQGISFIEAMAAGLPVIATPVGGIVDFLKDGETGLFCEVRNPKSIADAVKRLISNSALKEKITNNAHIMVKQKYDWDLIAKDMKDRVFESVI